ncbi:hypothetical protein MAP00_003841 [Monascus purpureus]|nr:hypothetical protein MAP00_003841 [Monascus purpureus]
MTESQASGELEGSTLGSSSRDGERRSREQRRRQTSGGFLLDSALLPRARPLRTDHYPEYGSDSSISGKRRVPEPSPAVPKKKSRYAWSRHKHSAEFSSPIATASSRSTDPPEVLPGPSEVPPSATSTHQGATDANEGLPGLDKDSIQIVNLALNLNESRKKGHPNRSSLGPVSGSRRAVSAQSSMAYSPSYGQHQFQTRNNLSRAYIGERSGALDAPNPTLSPVPGAVEGNIQPYRVSDATLQRAEKARVHFELFFEYLRLLPSLPPLRHPSLGTSQDSTKMSTDGGRDVRVYNPLQSIRNRKVRFREKCAIDPDADGWNDVERVRKWVDAVTDRYGQQDHEPVECLKLPSYLQGKACAVPEEQESIDTLAVSPPSSLRRVSPASNGIKPRRPRLDWMVSPSELLADAAWVEEDGNKAKVVDKEGNRLYPDSRELVSVGGSRDISSYQKWHRSGQQRPMEAESYIPEKLGSKNDLDFLRSGRGRPRHRSQSPSARKSLSRLRKHNHSRWLKSRARSTSSSSIASEGRYASKRERLRLLDLTTQTPRLKVSRGDIDDANLAATPDSGPSWFQSKVDRRKIRLHEKAGSISSAASADGRYDSHLSADAMDNERSGLIPRADRFPSIATGLSPPSSRSSSPSKKHLPRVIHSIHERSRSRYRDKESRTHIDGESSASENVSKRKTGPNRPSTNYPDLVEPDSIPDRPPSFHTEEQRVNDPPWADSSKGQNIPSQSESKLRGIFKGKGKIAEIVGNEVSKVGDFLRKDSTAFGRKLSGVPSLTSGDDGLDDNERTRPELNRSASGRLPAVSEQAGHLSVPNADKPYPRSSTPNLPTFRHSSRQASRVDLEDVVDPLDPHPQSVSSVADDPSNLIGEVMVPPAPQRSHPADEPLDDENRYLTLQKTRGPDTSHGKNVLEPFCPANPPVTGLAKAEASQGKRPKLTDASRNWSISGRSVSVSANVGLPDRKEIERVRALLLCSGIKAREVTRRVEGSRCPPEFLLKSLVNPTAPIPRMSRLEEHEFAARNLAQHLQKSKNSLQLTMDRFSAATCPSLKSQLDDLDNLVNQSLSRRVREAAADAEGLSVQLNTTTTLAVKQLSDALDKAFKRRRRRFQGLSRVGFVILEWSLVALMWWAWLIVMVFKVIRGVFRGAVSGIRIAVILAKVGHALPFHVK